MRIVVITGMSGSGKTTALKALEDAGYYAIDNLPVGLLDKLVDLFGASTELTKVALVVDARTHQAQAPTVLASVPAALEAIRALGHEVDLIFLDTGDNVLARRYSETRRRHPLSPDGSVEGGIACRAGAPRTTSAGCDDIARYECDVRARPSTGDRSRLCDGHQSPPSVGDRDVFRLQARRSTPGGSGDGCSILTEPIFC